MPRYEESSDDHVPNPLAAILSVATMGALETPSHEHTIEDTKTGETYTGYGSTPEEAREEAWKQVE